MDHLAKSLQMNPEELKAKNMYKQGDISYIVRMHLNLGPRPKHNYFVLIKADPKGMPLQYCKIEDLWKSQLQGKK